MIFLVIIIPVFPVLFPVPFADIRGQFRIIQLLEGFTEGAVGDPEIDKCPLRSQSSQAADNNIHKMICRVRRVKNVVKPGLKEQLVTLR